MGIQDFIEMHALGAFAAAIGSAVCAFIFADLTDGGRK